MKLPINIPTGAWSTIVSAIRGAFDSAKAYSKNHPKTVVGAFAALFGVAIADDIRVRKREKRAAKRHNEENCKTGAMLQKQEARINELKEQAQKSKQLETINECLIQAIQHQHKKDEVHDE